jgi:hypothetical protein
MPGAEYEFVRAVGKVEISEMIRLEDSDGNRMEFSAAIHHDRHGCLIAGGHIYKNGVRPHTFSQSRSLTNATVHCIGKALSVKAGSKVTREFACWSEEVYGKQGNGLLPDFALL